MNQIFITARVITRDDSEKNLSKDALVAAFEAALAEIPWQEYGVESTEVIGGDSKNYVPMDATILEKLYENLKPFIIDFCEKALLSRDSLSLTTSIAFSALMEGLTQAIHEDNPALLKRQAALLHVITQENNETVQ